MTFESAINSLSNGGAAKLSTWGGYIRKDTTTSGISAFSTTSTYTLGQLVTYNGDTYICTTAVTTAGEWSSANWTSTEKYTLTFVKRNASGTPPAGTVYTYTPILANGVVTYHVEPDGSDSSPDFESAESEQEWADMLPLDGALLLALCSNDWIVGTAEAFETARTGTSVW